MSCAICGESSIAGQIGRASVCSKCFNLYGSRGRALAAESMCVSMDKELESDGRVIALRESLNAAHKEIERLRSSSMTVCWNCGAAHDD